MLSEKEQSDKLCNIRDNFLNNLVEIWRSQKDKKITLWQAETESNFLVEECKVEIRDYLKQGSDINAIDENDQNAKGISIFAFFSKVQEVAENEGPETFPYLKDITKFLFDNGARNNTVSKYKAQTYSEYSIGEDGYIQKNEDPKELTVKSGGLLPEGSEINQL